MTTLDMSNYWVIGGITLLIGEMITGGFFLVFIALGCLGASIMAAIGQPVAIQLLALAITAVGGVTAFRKTLKRKFLSAMTVNSDVGKEIVVDTSILPHKRARISYQGTTWEAVNLGSEEIKPSDRVIIVGIDGISLLIRKVN